MDWLLVLLRLTHIVLGTLWVGMMAFNVAFLTPALRDAGPAGGPVMAALQRRKVMVVLPIVALLTIVSGVWLMIKVYGGHAGLMGSRMGTSYISGALAALLAFIVGILVMRPAMTRAAALAESLASAPSDAERAARSAEIQRLRVRGTVVGQVVMVLLLIAVAAMAVARYL